MKPIEVQCSVAPADYISVQPSSDETGPDVEVTTVIDGEAGYFYLTHEAAARLAEALLRATRKSPVAH